MAAVVFVIVYSILVTVCRSESTCRPIPASDTFGYSSLSSNWSESSMARARGMRLDKIGNLITRPAIAGSGAAYDIGDLVDMSEGEGSGLLMHPPITETNDGWRICMWLKNLLASNNEDRVHLLSNEDRTFYVEMRANEVNNDDDDGNGSAGTLRVVIVRGSSDNGGNPGRYPFMNAEMTNMTAEIPAGQFWTHICLAIPGEETTRLWKLYVNATLVGIIDTGTGIAALPDEGLDRVMIQGLYPVASMIDEVVLMGDYGESEDSESIERIFNPVNDCYNPETNPDSLELTDACMGDSFPLFGLTMSCDFESMGSCVWWGPGVWAFVDEYATGDFEVVEDGFAGSGIRLENSYIMFPSAYLPASSGATFAVWVRQVQAVRRGLFFVNGTGSGENFSNRSIGTFPEALESAPAHQWFHLAVIVTNTTATSYLDGEEVDQESSIGAGFWPIATLHSLGGSGRTMPYLNVSGFALYYDEFMYFNRTLSLDELRVISNVRDCEVYLPERQYIYYNKENLFDVTDYGEPSEGYYAAGLKQLPIITPRGRASASRSGCKTTLRLDDEAIPPPPYESQSFKVVYVLWPSETVGDVDEGTHMANYRQFALVMAEINSQAVLELKDQTRVVPLWQWLEDTDSGVEQDPAFYCFNTGVRVEGNLSNFDMHITCMQNTTVDIATVKACDKGQTSMTVGIVMIMLFVGVVLVVFVKAVIAKKSSTVVYIPLKRLPR